MSKKELTFVKVGTGVVSNAERTKLDMAAIRGIGGDIAAIEGHQRKAGEITRLDHEGSVILVSSGAVTAGVEQLGIERAAFSDVRMKQMASMVGNTTLFATWAQATGIVTGYDLPTHNDLRDKEHWDNMLAVIATNLQYGVLSGFNEGDARSTEELETIIRDSGGEHKRFGDNDQLTGQLGRNVAGFVNGFADQSVRAIFLTDTDGVYQDVNRRESRIDYLAASDIDYICAESVSTENISNGGMGSKLSVAALLAAAGVSVSIGAGKEPHALLRLQQYEAGFGTHIVA